jgi:hypothetical protein
MGKGVVMRGQMKKQSGVFALSVVILLAAANSAFAQWATVGNNINNTNTGNVGIGTPSPVTKLQVSGGDISMSADQGIRKDGDNFIFGYISALPGVVMGSGTPTDRFKINAGGVERLRIDTNGYVGLGTPTPSAPLHVRDSGENHQPPALPSFPPVLLYLERDIATGGDAAMAIQSSTKATGGTSRIYLGNSDEWDSTLISGGSGNLIFYARNGGGTLLEVARMAGNGTLTAGNIAAKYQDVAEWVPSSEELTPGTVVVLNPDHNNQVMPSSRAYDTAVAGVVSATPGIVLGEEAKNKEKVATTGRVHVRVDASKMPIRIGDLLVTSDRAGVAMRSEPVKVSGIEMHRPGTIIGKALEPLSSGEGEILVLLSLQ